MRSCFPGKDMKMQHTPFGYDIVDGRAVVNPEKAETLKKVISSYLSGKGFTAAAADAGLAMSHSGVKRLIQNERYLGDSFYPAIITEETARAIEEERLRREKALGRQDKPKKEHTEVPIGTRFSISAIEQKYEDPVLQAEYAYSLIESEVD